MRKFARVLCPLAFFLTTVRADDKISSQWKCDASAPETHSFNVGDKEGHAYFLAQGKCTPGKDSSIAEVKEQEGTYTAFSDRSGNSTSDHGTFVVTMANGDKLFYKYHGTSMTKDKKMVSGNNKWTITGTGKLKEIKGEGSFKGKGSDDGS